MNTIALKSDGQGSVNQFHAYFDDVFWRVPRADRPSLAASKFGYSLAAMKRYLSDQTEPPIVLTRLLWLESSFAEREIDAYRHWLLVNNEQTRTHQADEIKRLKAKIQTLEGDINDLKQRAAPDRRIAANASFYSAF